MTRTTSIDPPARHQALDLHMLGTSPAQLELPNLSRSMLDLPADLIVGDKKPCPSGFGLSKLSDRLVALSLTNIAGSLGMHLTLSSTDASFLLGTIAGA